MAKHVAPAQVLKLVLDLLSRLPDLPLLLINGVPEVLVSLDDGFHDELTPADDVKGRRVLANVVNCCTLGHSELL